MSNNVIGHRVDYDTEWIGSLENFRTDPEMCTVYSRPSPPDSYLDPPDT